MKLRNNESIWRIVNLVYVFKRVKTVKVAILRQMEPYVLALRNYRKF